MARILKPGKKTEEGEMTKQVNCGGVLIGGGAPVSIQSMTNVDTRDEKALLRQINELEQAGCQIVRVTVPDDQAADSFSRVRKKTDMPLVADIHFDYRMALRAIEAGADKIRINPGNIGGPDKLKLVVDAARKRNIPIRVGVNSGSLEKDLVAKYGKVTAKGLAESAVRTLKLIEDMDYDQLVLSVKSTDVRMTYDCHMLLRDMTDYPLHIGITESGTPENGIIKSAVGIGALLMAGIGDTVRVSLTTDPVEEVRVARKILEAAGLRKKIIDIVSCPTCGRTQVDLIGMANRAETALAPITARRQSLGLRPLKVAIMGCVVNGPGESMDADYGIAGGKGQGLVFAGGQVIETLPEDRLIDRLVELITEDTEREIKDR